ncbi:hypothetical protein M1B35_13550 [Pseudomonas sp. MAFF 302046]|jgi:hypothetical protein|uniref:Uncharacterized protein n=1 Tax=Pseudomonas morbosilactucae TaxID=2938197 RepID=A0ABT0JGX5_9PSED|nr:hypothetical protein [Pseudomonas morbosilactucae]MCK9815128.1 hypothetical protein [Pseudomonas morbosilactucae]
MKALLSLLVLLPLCGIAQAADIPLFNVDCPGNIAVSADPGGPVLINGQEAKTRSLDEHRFEAKGNDITLSISVADDDSVKVTYTGKHGAKGLCEAVDD